MTLLETLSKYGPMSKQTLFMGEAHDGGSIVLKLRDQSTGALLVAGDARSGKTSLLHTLADVANITHSNNELTFAVHTAHPEEWQDTENYPGNLGVLKDGTPGASEYIQILYDWARKSIGSPSTLLFMIDNLENLIETLDGHRRDNLHWLLRQGPARNIRPIVTINTASISRFDNWMDIFPTKIFGPMFDPNITKFIGADLDVLATLSRGSEFTLNQRGQWLNFSLPAHDED